MTKILTNADLKRNRYYWITKDQYFPGREYFSINQEDDSSLTSTRLARWVMGGQIGGLIMQHALGMISQKRLPYHEVVFDLKGFCARYDVEGEAVRAVISKFKSLPQPCLVEFEFPGDDQLLVRFDTDLVKKRTDYVENKYFHLSLRAALDVVDWENSDITRPKSNQEDDDFLVDCSVFGDDLADWTLYEISRKEVPNE